MEYSLSMQCVHIRYKVHCILIYSDSPYHKNHVDQNIFWHLSTTPLIDEPLILINK